MDSGAPGNAAPPHATTRRPASGSPRSGTDLPPGCARWFLLPFAGFGVFALIQACRSLAGGRTTEGLFLLLFGLVFTGIGLGLGLGFQRLLRREQERKRLLAQHPNEPWRARPDWASGIIRSSQRLTAFGAWVAAGFWNLVSIPAAVAVLHQDLPRQQPAAWLVLIFPLVGLALLAWAIRATLQLRKFGVSLFRLSRVPGTLGGDLSGVIEIPAKIRPEGGFRLRLACVRRVTTGAGKNRHTHEHTLWEDEKTLVQELLPQDPRRSGIPVFFAIPPDQPASDDTQSRDQVIWRLDLRAAVPGVDYEAQFEVPVFGARADEPAAPPRPDPTAAFQPAPGPLQRPPPSQLVIRSGPSGGREFHFPAGRNLGSALVLGLLLIGWCALIGFLVWRGAPMLFPIVFGAFGALLAWALVESTFKSTQVEVTPTDVTVRHRRFGLFESRRQLPAGAAHGFVVRPGVRSGSRQLWEVRLDLGGDRAYPIVGMLAHRKEADWIAREMTAALGRSST